MVRVERPARYITVDLACAYILDGSSHLLLLATTKQSPDGRGGGKSICQPCLCIHALRFFLALGRTVRSCLVRPAQVRSTTDHDEHELRSSFMCWRDTADISRTCRPLLFPDYLQEVYGFLFLHMNIFRGWKRVSGRQSEQNRFFTEGGVAERTKSFLYPERS